MQNYSVWRVREPVFQAAGTASKLTQRLKSIHYLLREGQEDWSEAPASRNSCRAMEQGAGGLEAPGPGPDQPPGEDSGEICWQGPSS